MLAFVYVVRNQQSAKSMVYKNMIILRNRCKCASCHDGL